MLYFCQKKNTIWFTQLIELRMPAQTLKQSQREIRKTLNPKNTNNEKNRFISYRFNTAAVFC